MKKIIVLILSLLAFSSHAEQMEFCIIDGQNGAMSPYCYSNLQDCQANLSQYSSNICVARPKTR